VSSDGKPSGSGSLFAGLFGGLFTAETQARAARDTESGAQKAPEGEVTINVRFVKPDDPISDGDREAYLKWCEGKGERRALMLEKSEAERIAYWKRYEADIAFWEGWVN